MNSPSLATVDPGHAEATSLLESGTKLLEEGIFYPPVHMNLPQPEFQVTLRVPSATIRAVSKFIAPQVVCSISE